MKRFKNILLITNKNDINSPDIQRAISLARSNKANLTIADVVFDLTIMHRQLKPSSGVESVLNSFAEKRLQELKLISRELSTEVEIKPMVLEGTPFLEIIRVVMQFKCDLVIKISEPEKNFTAKIFGSTDFRLLRKCPCPVWLLKPETSFSFNSILAAVALESFDEDEDLEGLNKQILEMATSLAMKESSELHIVHAWKVFGDNLLSLPMAGFFEEEVKEWMVSQRIEIERRFNHLTELLLKHLKANDMEMLTLQFHLVEGDPEEIIQGMVNDKKVDLVVMGTVVRSNLAGLLMGNTAENILNRLSCSVLTVKPSSFITPVRFD